MPIPSFNFDEPGAGLPRQPVPVRFACLAADWSPALFAEMVRGLGGEFPPLLTVYAFDAATGHVGEVRKDAYDKIRALKAPLPDALATIPPHHFVWSDDLEFAYSEFVDLTMDRETAVEDGMGIRWSPDLVDCGAVVAEAVDLSPLIKPGENRCFAANDVRTFVFDSKTAQFKDSTGLRYISHLLFHPGKKVHVVDLDRVVRPPIGGHEMAAAEVAEAVAGKEEDPDSPNRLQIEDPRRSIGEAMLDDEAVASIKSGLAKLQEQYDDLTERGSHDKARLIAEKMDPIRKNLLASRNKHGRSRRLGSEADKLRKSVGNAIARALDSLDNAHPSLARHLRATVKTGTDCEYRSPESIRWTS